MIHEKFGDNIAYKLTSGEGDIDAAMKAADKIVSQKMVHQRLAPIAMEPRGVLARYFPGEEELTVRSSTQIPHLLRTQLALMIGIPENKLRVITPEVGGGFGSKLNVYAEEALLGWISIQLGKPVKWIESRRENMQATIHGRAQVGTVEVGVKNDGTITGLRYNVVADLGAYHQLLTPAIPTLTGLMLSGAYKIPAIQMNVTGVFTNKMSTDAYRGAGRPEAILWRLNSKWIRSNCDARTFQLRLNSLFTPRRGSNMTVAITRRPSTRRWIFPAIRSCERNSSRGATTES